MDIPKKLELYRGLKYKSRYGLARARFIGLAKNMTAYGIAAIAHNLLKGGKLLTLNGLPDPNYAR
jgi:transposase, IS5 family